MNHPAELAVYNFLKDAVAGKTSISDENAEQIAADVKAAVLKQFDSEPRGEFRLRMSNIGRPKCQLWFEKNDPENKTPPPPHFLMNMLLGDIVEAVFKGLLRAAGVAFEGNKKVTLNLPDGTEINGEYDIVLDDKVDDIKSASPWAYQNKFESFDKLRASDGFGYVAQLVGYAEAAGKEVGGWWVINKATGEFKYVPADTVDKEQVLTEVQELVKYINNGEAFERCFAPEQETYYNKPSGNLVLSNSCKFCDFKHKCWPTLKSLPSRVSKAKNPPEVEYVLVAE